MKKIIKKNELEKKNLMEKQNKIKTKILVTSRFYL